jgi:hypothetical protein
MTPLRLDQIPYVLKQRKQWLLWYRSKSGDKMAIAPDGDALSGTGWQRAERWVRFEQAVGILSEPGLVTVRNLDKKYQEEHPNEPPRYYTFKAQLAGIGFGLNYQSNPAGEILVAFDIDDHSPDHKLNLVKDGVITNDMAKRLVTRLNSYTEVTPSGAGLRVLCLVSRLPSIISRSVINELRYRDNLVTEVYVAHKFITVTGQHIEGTPTDIQLHSLDEVMADFVGPRQSKGNGLAHRITSNRHLFLKDMAAKAVMSLWIDDAEVLADVLGHLYDRWCDPQPHPVSDEEIARIADWAVSTVGPDQFADPALLDPGDCYLVATLRKQDPRFNGAWTHDLALFDGDPGTAFSYLSEALFKACGKSEKDIERFKRIYSASPFSRISENEVPAHLRDLMLDTKQPVKVDRLKVRFRQVLVKCFPARMPDYAFNNSVMLSRYA